MRHGEDGEMAGAWIRDQRVPERPTPGEARLARFDATQDLLLEAGALASGALDLAQHDAQAERLAEACRRYLAAHHQVKAGGR